MRAQLVVGLEGRLELLELLLVHVVLVAGGGDGGRAEEVEERVELLRLENILALLVLLLHRLVGNVLAAVPLDLRSFTCPEHLHGKI